MSNLVTPPPATPDGPVLDAAALARLRDLDPGGSSRLLERVVAAFETSAARLLGQLREARIGGDTTTIRHVAHTLKSSAASVGALSLSQHCAQIEAAVREGRADDAEPDLDAVFVEMEPVLRELRALVGGPA